MKEHLDTKLKEDKLLEQLTNVGLEVESVENLSEGFDLFKRSQGQLDIGYLKRPLFFYRQHDGSMSKNNLEERQKIYSEINESTRLL